MTRGVYRIGACGKEESAAALSGQALVARRTVLGASCWPNLSKSDYDSDARMLKLTVLSKRSPDSIMQKQKALLVALLMVVAGSLAISTRAMAQEQSGKVIPNAVWVGADGRFESDPDTALVQF